LGNMAEKIEWWKGLVEELQTDIEVSINEE
jgi:hypothetical protein